ncbi:unnamed protein product [Triticum turgidum subsp. durum]|uniref:Uncharacterized protein n=1 Tax=Triticum turgidum subsp. durum TaxID=4567 RepID=A0A9R1NQI8_TRITD|nr:unnamed protein product [Triticum turgidum subsp. durum]
MAQTMASMTGLSQGVRLPGPAGRRASRFTVRASSAEAEAAGRRAVLGLMASGVVGSAFAQVVHAGTVAAIKVGPPPPLSGGLPGTDNSDEARDFNLKPLIDKKQWPYVMNDLRLRASYLRYDLKTVISSKTTKEEKKDLKDLTGKLFATLDGLDHAAKIKSPTEAEKYYGETKTVLGDVLAKLG